MRLFIFYNASDETIHRLQHELRVFSNLIEVKYFNSFDNFTAALRSSFLSETLVIYFVAEEACIQLARTIRKMLVKAKLLFIFRDNDPALVYQVNEFYPRYYTFASGDLKDVKAVITRIINNFEQSGFTKNNDRSEGQIWGGAKAGAANSLVDR